MSKVIQVVREGILTLTLSQRRNLYPRKIPPAWAFHTGTLCPAASSSDWLVPSRTFILRSKPGQAPSSLGSTLDSLDFPHQAAPSPQPTYPFFFSASLVCNLLPLSCKLPEGRGCDSFRLFLHSYRSAQGLTLLLRA